MDYSVLFDQVLTQAGFDLHPVYNCFEPPYNHTTGWELKLPAVEFGPTTLVLLHFQDFVTLRDQYVLELQKVEKFYGVHSNQVLVTHWTHNLTQVYTGPVNLIEFSNHNYDLACILSSRWDEWQPITVAKKTRAWQCLNGRMCHHRRRAVDVLQTWGNGTLSYGNEITLPEWAYETYRGTENDENFMRLGNLYGSTAVNIVTETEYQTTPGIITEKTLMAFASQQIPVVIGHRGIVQHCKELGFDMFDDLVDISYDTLPNEIRVEQALLRNQDLILGNIDLAPYRDRLIQQRQFLLNQYPTLMQQKFRFDVQQLQTKLLTQAST
jgi:hypothetical protein